MQCGKICGSAYMKNSMSKWDDNLNLRSGIKWCSKKWEGNIGLQTRIFIFNRSARSDVFVIHHLHCNCLSLPYRLHWSENAKSYENQKNTRKKWLRRLWTRSCFLFCLSIYVGVVQKHWLRGTFWQLVASEFLRYSFYHVKSFRFRGLHYNGN